MNITINGNSPYNYRVPKKTSFNLNWTIISVAQFQMLFKVVGQNRWVIWYCFASTKNCHPCCLGWACHIWKLFFHLRIRYQQPRLSRPRQLIPGPFQSYFFSAHFNFGYLFFAPKQFKISHIFWPTNLSSIWHCPTDMMEGWKEFFWGTL